MTWPDGNLRRYHYEDSRFARALTGITDEAGVRWATYVYDAQGRVARSEHVGGVDRVDFAYGFDANAKPRAISRSLLNQLSFAYDTVGRVSQLTDPAGANAQYVYDAVGNLFYEV